ncbi:MAG: hypothetical protein ABSG68_16215 [Thermoguttaceae bacterium]|jgi:hypothetical protein
MLACFQQFDNMDDLRQYINTTICEQYQLQSGEFPMTERILLRGKKPCGVYFCLHGPRATKFSAIWDIDRNQILFYGSGGERFQKTQLIDSPMLESAAA